MGEYTNADSHILGRPLSHGKGRAGDDAVIGVQNLPLRGGH
jgi:hypothetical protein